MPAPPTDNVHAPSSFLRVSRLTSYLVINTGYRILRSKNNEIWNIMNRYPGTKSIKIVDFDD